MRLLAVTTWIAMSGASRAFKVVTRRPIHPLVGVTRLTCSGTEASEGCHFWESRQDCWRPDVQDVERISWGKPARKKRTGSRGVPHRLNQEERFLFDQGRRKGYLEVGGSGWRSQRRDAPLLNSYRSLCDAIGRVCVVLYKQKEGIDEVEIDLSPLRLPESFESVAEACVERVGIAPVLERDDGLTRADDDLTASSDDWESRPIYQLAPFLVRWKLPRPDAKATGRVLAEIFDTADPKAAISRKPSGVKHGRGRRHGGYGIG